VATGHHLSSCRGGVTSTAGPQSEGRVDPGNGVQPPIARIDLPDNR
jgi:hypothetical protein